MNVIKQHLLVVDDDKITHFILRKMFEKNSFYHNPTLFNDAFEAISHLKKNYKIGDKFIIFLDINMPNMNGWQFLDAISGLFLPINTYVIMISSSNDENDKNKALNNEFVIAFHSKPIRSEDLKSLQNKIESLYAK
jgi:CheY-like chemotaxis protein